MEERVGPLIFFSNFDSGNLAKVERVKSEEDASDKEDGNNTGCVPDYEYNAWTWPDAAGTEYENLNRTWFYFGVKGGTPGRVLKINMMNLNRQGKLYSQGMSPFVKVLPGRNKWERIRDRPTYETIDGQFRLSFTYRFPDQRNSVHYFAFCYPYSYTELQTHLDKLDKQYSSCRDLTPTSPKTNLYYQRELLCNTLDSLRLDLLTISSCKGMIETREDRLPSLFPDLETPRPPQFQGKKVFFLSARVHPGETPSSYVFNGFLDFILRPDDPRAAALRDQYVFKMIPMLNPDGVKRGHYRTDPRGVNLNRVYLEPDPGLHPSIYAAKSVIMYHHSKRDPLPKCTCKKTSNASNEKENTSTVGNEGEEIRDRICFKERLPPDGMESSESDPVATNVADDMTVVSAGTPDFEASKGESERTLGDGGTNTESPETSSIADRQVNIETKEDIDKVSNKVQELSTTEENNNLENEANEISEEDETKRENLGPTLEKDESSESCSDQKCEACLSNLGAQNKGKLQYYVDLHGHASKRGCFVYANYMEDEENYVKSILFPKLASLNSANFDFTGCNFTEKNMYSKDKRDGMSKEGSGRVAIFKATSIVHSYTLECNYNSGRMINAVPPATCDSSRATPPPPPGFPPKFTPEIFEEVGRAIAVAVLDMNNSNPWSRLPLSEFGSLEGVKNWVRRFVKSAKNAPSVPRKLSRAAAKTSSIVAGATATTRQKIGSSFKSSSSGDMSSDGLSAAAQKITDRMTQNINANKEAAAKKNSEEAKPPKRIQALAMPRRLSQPVSGTTGRPENTKMIPPTNGHVSDSQTVVVAPLRGQLYKSKDQTRVSLDLPKTGPSLRIPRPNQPLGSGMKALSCPADLRIGGNSVDIHNNLLSGLQPRLIPACRPGGGSASDDEKRKKSLVRKTKNGRKKSQTDKPEGLVQTSIPPRLSDTRQPTRPREVEPLWTGANKKIPEVKRKGSGGRALLQRSNSKNKNIINSSARSCEVVDITELPQNGGASVAYWIDT